MKKLLLVLLISFVGVANAAPNYLQAPAPRQHVASAPVAATSTSTSAQLIAVNLARTGLNCTNLGSVSIFIGYGTNSAILNGGTVIPAGATWWMDDYLFTTQAVNVISASSANIACTEYQ